MEFRRSDDAILRFESVIDGIARRHAENLLYCRVKWIFWAVHGGAVAVWAYDGSLPPPVRILFGW